MGTSRMEVSLNQIEYAQEAVRKGGTVVGVRGRDIVVLVVEKKSTPKLQDDVSMRKICSLDEHIVMAFAGLMTDARLVINRAQFECQNERLKRDEPISLVRITEYIADLKQHSARSNLIRPFGVSCLIAGFDYDGSPHLFHTDPTGVHHEWKAKAIGRDAKKAKDFLEKGYDETLVESDEETIKLAIRAFLEVRAANGKNMEIAIMQRGRPVKILDADEIDAWVAGVKHEDRERENE